MIIYAGSRCSHRGDVFVRRVVMTSSRGWSLTSSNVWLLWPTSGAGAAAAVHYRTAPHTLCGIFQPFITNYGNLPSSHSIITDGCNFISAVLSDKPNQGGCMHAAPSSIRIGERQPLRCLLIPSLNFSPTYVGEFSTPYCDFYYFFRVRIFLHRAHNTVVYIRRRMPEVE